jgi:hypothetical protein
MIAFIFLTLGIYYMVWFFRRRTALNQLNSPRKLPLWPLLVFTVDFVIEVGFGIAAGDVPLDVAFGPGVAGLLALARLVAGILMIWQCFVIKDIIEDHATPDDAGLQPMFVQRVKLSGVATFFLSIFYLQYAINRYIVSPREQAV